MTTYNNYIERILVYSIDVYSAFPFRFVGDLFERGFIDVVVVAGGAPRREGGESFTINISMGDQ